MAEKDPSKTENATPKRVKKARGEGSVAKSQEMGKVMTLLAGLIAMRFAVKLYYEQFEIIFQWFFTKGFSTPLTPKKVYMLFLWCSEKLALLLLPIFAFIALVSYLTLRLQVGKLWTTKVFKPKFAKLFNLTAGIKRLLLDMQTLVRLAKSILQAVVVALAPYIVIKQEMHNFLPLFYSDATQLAAYVLSVGYKMMKYSMLPMLIIAGIDLWYMRYEYNENLKMTKDEIKDERKQAEGDEKVKMAMKQRMMAMVQKRMMADIPKADVVITNPTHYAIALRYDAIFAPAPQVIAKGTNKLAQRIKEIAKENNIPIRENKPLAQALYKQVEVGDIIPEEMYQAVAAILAKLHKFKRD